jgi:hypothetical protein
MSPPGTARERVGRTLLPAAFDSDLSSPMPQPHPRSMAADAAPKSLSFRCASEVRQGEPALSVAEGNPLSVYGGKPGLPDCAARESVPESKSLSALIKASLKSDWPVPFVRVPRICREVWPRLRVDCGVRVARR